VSRVIRAADKAKVRFARDQRKQLTAGERALWQALRAGKSGARFRRQHPVGQFVLDFYCDAARLAIEVDGPTHEETVRYDQRRDELLANEGIRVLRIPSDRIHCDLVGVLREIHQSVRGNRPE
jgi:very-short-patch-repair endonuclease